MVRRALAIVLLVASLTGCATTSDDAPLSPAAVAAAANVTSLDFTGDLSTTEMLDVRTGQITALADVVTGERAVLLWYWAPD